MSEIIQRMMEIPSNQYGAYESSFDRYPDERRWAKRMALYKLRGLICSLSRRYDSVVVKDIRIIQLCRGSSAVRVFRARPIHGVGSVDSFWGGAKS